MTVSHVTTHILDTSTGKPAADVPVRLLARENDEWAELGRNRTDSDGRIKNLGPEVLDPGTYRLEFATAGYFASRDTETFFPEVVLTFTVDKAEAHYHIPLLLSPFSFSSYRGS